RNRSSKKLRTLSENGADQQSTVGSSPNGNLSGARILRIDQCLCGRNEIVEHILFLFFRPSLMPFTTVLSSTPKIRHRANPSLLDPTQIRFGKRRRDRNIESAITREVGRI